jgi:hypothetical protein
MDHIANLTELRNALVNQRVGERTVMFKMTAWTDVRECGTAACIGGTAQIIMQEETGCKSDYSLPTIARWMGRNFDADELFFCESRPLLMGSITLVDAIAVVDHLLAGNRFANWADFGYGRTAIGDQTDGGI